MNYAELVGKYNLMSLEDALIACFGEIASGDGENEGYKVECCGKVTYGSGIIGSDVAQCQGCGRKIVNVLSPHTSPLLIDWDRNVTGIPSEEMMAALWDTPWMVILPEE